MQLTTFTDHALRTLIYLGTHHERLCTAKEIAGFYHISLNHMGKAVHRLSQLEIIHSQKGKGGGIQLNKSPRQINLGAIVKQLENNFYLAECFNPEANHCILSPNCRLKSILGNALSDFFNHLSQYTLADILPK